MVLAVRTDVSQARDVETLADKALEAFGAVHLLCNNAGVATEAPVWESTLAEWEWVMGVNLWGVVHGVRVFVPIMLAQDAEYHIVNTTSMAGLISGPGLGVYKVTKHAVVTLSETLYYELAERGAKIRISVLCPGIVNTRILESARNRPGQLPMTEPLAPASRPRWEALRYLVPAGMPPEQVADAVFGAIREDQFYILTHPEAKEAFARGWKTSSRNIIRPLKRRDRRSPPGHGRPSQIRPITCCFPYRSHRPRCVGPLRAGHFGLRAHVDVSEADWWTCGSCRGGADRRALAPAR
jgi:NAD(P)-dependent dehydrogenase (short-subunit alcohol dehydrogenase family)